MADVGLAVTVIVHDEQALLRIGEITFRVIDRAAELLAEGKEATFVEHSVVHQVEDVAL